MEDADQFKEPAPKFEYALLVRNPVEKTWNVVTMVDDIVVGELMVARFNEAGFAAVVVNMVVESYLDASHLDEMVDQACRDAAPAIDALIERFGEDIVERAFRNRDQTKGGTSMTNLNDKEALDKSIWDTLEEMVVDGVAETVPPGQPRDAWNNDMTFRLAQ